MYTYFSRVITDFASLSLILGIYLQILFSFSFQYISCCFIIISLYDNIILHYNIAGKSLLKKSVYTFFGNFEKS